MVIAKMLTTIIKSNLEVIILVLLSISIVVTIASPTSNERLQDFLKNNVEKDDEQVSGTRWAVLVAGSKGFWNYRHQADICHAYQLLKKGGLKDENIVVFMFDDIAYAEENPFKGKIFNHPNGSDVYQGVLKDYTGEYVTASNFFAVLEGNRSEIVGGNGKVLESGPEDHVFIYYSDHGASGLIGMPDDKYVYADQLNEVLRKMHENKRYKSLLFYLEACESGSIFKGFKIEELNIYAVTASNENESSYATYCPTHQVPPTELSTCLGDLYSVSWMEDTEQHDRHDETIKEQYRTVKERVGKGELV